MCGIVSSSMAEILKPREGFTIALPAWRPANMALTCGPKARQLQRLGRSAAESGRGSMDTRLVFLLLVPVLLGAFATFDRIVRREYATFRENWEQDGRPAGFFWRPAELGLTSGAATQWAMLRWVFRTPAWAVGGGEVVRLVGRLLRLVVTWLARDMWWFG